MRAALRHLFSDHPAEPRGRLIGLYALLVGANMLAWGWALAAFAGHPAFFEMAFLAYVLGLRHAVDADHIAAIDNVVRKLMQEGKRPLSVGFFFSLGHSTVVVLAAAAIAGTAAAVQSRFSSFRELGSLIGTSVSSLFLLVIGAINLAVLCGVWRSFQSVRRGGALASEDLDALLAGSGLLARVFRRLFRLVSRSWQMFPLGFLFGLGFDTASEISLFAVAAAHAARGMPFASTLIFPVLFTVAMALVDTTDSVLMVGAYGWAFVNPLRKLWYNLTITGVSVVVAFVIGGVEALGLLGEKLALGGWFWQEIAALNENLGRLGLLLLGVFAASWAISFLIFRWKRFDEQLPAAE
jgi:high-affinity nickel-transport protein